MTYNKCSSNRGTVWISKVAGSDLWILINNFGLYHENFENVKNYLGALFTLTKLVLEKYLGGNTIGIPQSRIKPKYTNHVNNTAL